MSDASDFDAVRDGIGVDTGTSSGDEETVAAAHAALDRLESQNQALQEERDLAEAQRDVALRRRETLRENWMEALRRAEALQERAEKAEARLQLAEDALAMYQAGAVTHISIESRPTQETDPE